MEALEFVIVYIAGMLTIPIAKIVIPIYRKKLEKKIKQKIAEDPI